MAYVLATVGCIKLSGSTRRWTCRGWQVVIPVLALVMLGLHALPQRVPVPRRGTGPLVPRGRVRLAAPRHGGRARRPGAGPPDVGGVPAPRRVARSARRRAGHVVRTESDRLGVLTDHHCHGLVTTDLDRDGFEALMNEAPRASALGTSLFDSMLGLAIRRHCAPVLDLEPLAPADAYLARRRELGAAEVNRRFLAAAGIGTFLVDTGLDGPGGTALTTPAELAGLADGDAYQVVRLERVVEQVLREETDDVTGCRRGPAPHQWRHRREEHRRIPGRPGPPRREAGPGRRRRRPARRRPPAGGRPDRQRLARPHRAGDRAPAPAPHRLRRPATSTCWLPTRCTSRRSCAAPRTSASRS